MSAVRENRWITLYFALFFSILLGPGFGAGSAHAQLQVQNPLENKDILILNPFESNIPAFEKTNEGLSAILRSGGIGIRNQFYEHLDLRRNPGPEHREIIVELMHQRYDQININWRNWYLTSAKELDGSLDVTKAHLLPGQNFAAPDVVSALPARVNIEGLTVRLKAEETHDVEMILGFEFRGTNEHYALEIRRGITQFHETLPEGNYSVLLIDKEYLSKNPLNFVNLKKGKEEGKVGVKGNWDEVETFLSFFDFEPHPLWLTLR